MKRCVTLELISFVNEPLYLLFWPNFNIWIEIWIAINLNKKTVVLINGESGLDRKLALSRGRLFRPPSALYPRFGMHWLDLASQLYETSPTNLALVLRRKKSARTPFMSNILRWIETTPQIPKQGAEDLNLNFQIF